ncbi:helix-turn-helix domain-containing protein [Flavobacterium pectinovorum]|uniref:XRE family transcriptional regulator n=1 Tax=Flavobacterium pectinovorum TaxID=29533 RepID=A0A502EJ22_9FLAO|nr:helix-turn-helix transcriptional regulator [Flavobacterium pectinovorum]TPG37753.1 XRE family transcriptional regulator [Flavobacterium pectinovorum]
MSNSLDKKDFQILFGKQLEKFRTAKNLSYRQLAQRCDLDHSDISKIEKGETNIQLSSVLQLSKGLNIHPSELFNFEFHLDKE